MYTFNFFRSIVVYSSRMLKWIENNKVSTENLIEPHYDLNISKYVIIKNIQILKLKKKLIHRIVDKYIKAAKIIGNEDENNLPAKI